MKIKGDRFCEVAMFWTLEFSFFGRKLLWHKIELWPVVLPYGCTTNFELGLNEWARKFESSASFITTNLNNELVVQDFKTDTLKSALIIYHASIIHSWHMSILHLSQFRENQQKMSYKFKLKTITGIYLNMGCI